MSDVVLSIPQKLLSDNFKLLDFQNDFKALLDLILSNTAQIKKIDFIDNDMDVLYDNGKLKQFRFEKNGVQITKVINLTDNKEININW